MNTVTRFKYDRTTRGQTTSGLTHECGVFGLVGTGDQTSNDVAQLILFALESLQHRGQESAGIVTNNGKQFNTQKGMGLVQAVFSNDTMKNLKGNMGIGHTRYSTAAPSENINCQPFVVHSKHGLLGVAHNGELVNASSLRKMVLNRGFGLSTRSDSELIQQVLCLCPPDGEVNGPDWPARIRHLMQLAPLSYSLVLMLEDRIYAVRDPYGNRPLCLGKFPPSHALNGTDNKSEGWAVSSESCAFLSFFDYVREILPGEILEMTSNGPRTVDIVGRPNNHPQAFCIFEYVYFARPTSKFEGQEVYTVRVNCGKQLALEHPVEADIVGAVPQSGNAAAYGYAVQSKITYGEVLAKTNHVGRSFTQPNNALRQLKIALKFSAIHSNVNGKRVILIDDSIVRGNTIGPIIKLLRSAGAKEVHIRVASPPLRHPCYMGINIPTRTELIANTHESKDLCVQVGADSLEYLSVDGLVQAVQRDIKENNPNVGHCTACLTGKYPGGVPAELDW